MLPAIEELVPHRAPMLWLDALTDFSDTTATATACFNEGSFSVADGTVLETALVECMAQTVAAALGQRVRASGKTGVANNGVLAAVSNFKILSRPPIGRTITIEIRELKRFGLMLLIAGKISCDGQLIASGELSLYA